MIFFLAVMFTFTGCFFNQPIKTSTAMILIKTPKMKFFDKGFISKYEDYTEVQILSAGTTVLKLKIYKNQICKDTFECQSFEVFNKEFLHSSYNKNFIKEIFESNNKEVFHRDRVNKILIKIKKD